MIEVTSLAHHFGKYCVLNGISFEVEKGAIIALLGENGAGKTTLLRLLAGYFMPQQGSVRIAGFDSQTQGLEMKRHLGYLPEKVAFYSDMRVGSYLEYRGSLKGIPRRRIAEKVLDVLDLCHLRSVEKYSISQLSAGYRQRLGLADALVNEPEVLLLDEPFSTLDPLQQEIMRQLIENLAQRHTLFFGTHTLEGLEKVCSSVFFLQKGQLSKAPQMTLENHYLAHDHLILTVHRKESHIEMGLLENLENITLSHWEKTSTGVEKIFLQLVDTPSFVEASFGEQKLLRKQFEQDIKDRILSKIREAGWQLLSYSWQAPSLYQKMAEMQQLLNWEEEEKEDKKR